jgi:hypothetical protein
VVRDVVVQKLDVARLKLHLEAQLFRDLGQEIERLVLRRRDPRDLGDPLSGLDERARVLARESPVAHAEDRKRVPAPVAAALLALARPVVILVKQGVQIGPARQDRVVDRHRADDLADAPGARRPDAEQAHHVRAIGVKA